MAGRFDGLSDLEWKLFEDLFNGYVHWKRKPGRRPTPLRWVVNSQLYVLITGCRWCDVPCGKGWASKSAAHRYVQAWERDGTVYRLKERILALAQERGMIQWRYGAIDGSFSPWEGRRQRRGAWI